LPCIAFADKHSRFISFRVRYLPRLIQSGARCRRRGC
jgi:hypothetical protein